MSRRLWFGAWIVGAVVLAVLLFMAPLVLRPASSQPQAAPAVTDSPSSIPTGSPTPSPSALPSVPATEPDPHDLPVVIVASELGFVAARTEPGAVCTATASVGADTGLGQPRTANAFGRVEFRYQTSAAVPGRGTGIHTVTCSLGDRHGSSTDWYNASGG